ncbi:trans-L-3-hydroxyproline dehydratase-like [Lytechinus pictus]|uniref:trans-L-3-hydroxyproline dehydratase-like n=1 Tax=Lytechinus pictus TaxID=7653 RepID=UPI0030B9E514
MVDAVIAKSPFKIHTMEMNVGGDPLRIVVSGYPEMKGDTLLERYRFTRDHLDHIRRAIILEPRGHYDMWGAIPIKPDNPEAHIGACYLNAEGYNFMCGHATIGLARYTVDSGLVEKTSPETQLNIQLPCGLLKAYVEYNEETKTTGRTRFTSVPAFLWEKDAEIEVPGFGKVKVDVSFGGVFYVLVSTSQLGLDIVKSPLRDLKDAGIAITKATNDAISVQHPENPDINCIVGTILTDGNETPDTDTTYNLLVYGDQGMIARAPCGSGTVSRVAMQYQKGLTDLNQPRYYKSRWGSSFIAKAVETTKVGDRDAVRIEVSGRGHYIGQNTFFFEENDEMGKGFMVD